VFDILMRDPKLVEVKVAKVNLPPSSLKSRLLCEMTYSGFEGYVPFDQEQYQPLNDPRLFCTVQPTEPIALLTRQNSNN
jgi:hypothetical protein